MLVRVAPGQVRFVLPGLAPTSRGLALGSDILFRFATLDRVVSFLRILTAEANLDDAAASVQILLARHGQGAREVLVRLSQVTQHAIDVPVRAARAAQGQGFTGSGRHFVALRDTRSPLGYDVDHPGSGVADLTVHAHQGELAFKIDGELSLRDLVMRLELVREPHGPEGLAPRALPPLCYLTVRQGLGETMVSYFHRTGVIAFASLCEPESSTGEVARFHFFRLQDPPARLVRLLRTTPGVSMFLPAASGVAVAAGYRHPLHLDACGSLFGGDRLLLLQPSPLAPRLLEPAPRAIAVERLISVARPAEAPSMPEAIRSTALDMSVGLSLVRGAIGKEHPMAALIPWDQIAWARRVFFALPAPLLAHHRVVALASGLLVISSDGLTALPFGTLFKSAARGVFIPLGCALRPSVSEGLLEERLGTGGGRVVLFTEAGPPVGIEANRLSPLEASLLSRLELSAAEERERTDEPMTADLERELRYRDRNLMPLWGAG
ncbi:MAG: hypothetical protein SGI86_12355 [Deltaproteobacteria bacterium]|nr:hypothetical protein [Deltaproteobacteria bacterium]